MLMSQFGATFQPKGRFYFPLKLISSKMPIGINYKAGVSAQLKSAVLFAGLNSYGQTKIFEKEISRDHTEKILSVNRGVLNIKKNPIKTIQINGKKK